MTKEVVSKLTWSKALNLSWCIILLLARFKLKSLSLAFTLKFFNDVGILQELNMPDLDLNSALGQSIINLALVEVDLCLQDHNTRLSNFGLMPQPDLDLLTATVQSHLEAEE